MWYIVVFQPSKCRNTHFQPQIWSIWPIFPNDSESLPKVCYINWKNSEILSKLRISEPVGVSAPAAERFYFTLVQKMREGRFHFYRGSFGVRKVWHSHSDVKINISDSADYWETWEVLAGEKKVRELVVELLQHLGPAHLKCWIRRHVGSTT